MTEPAHEEESIALGEWGEAMCELLEAIEQQRLLGIVFLVRKHESQDIEIGRYGHGNYESLIKNALVIEAAPVPQGKWN